VRGPGDRACYDARMRTRDDVSAEKLRGSFATPSRLVQRCLDRIAELTAGRDGLLALEPSAGDGTFVRALATHPLRERLAHVTACEPDPRDAERCRHALAGTRLDGEVQRRSALGLAKPRFDVAFGNPPFVRFQFVSATDRRDADRLAARLGIRLQGVANLWVAVLLAALTSLRDGGSFAFVVPSECFTGVSAGCLRRWLAEGAEDLAVELFGPGSFPGVVQEVVVLSGRRSVAPARHPRLHLDDHSGPTARRWTHRIDARESTWTRWLLGPGELDALERAASSPGVVALGRVARFEVAAVTGANDFFSVDGPTLARYGLEPWARPLLPRVRHARGLVYGHADHEATVASGARTALLDFAAGASDPRAHDGARRYLHEGEEAGLPTRFKCRIRDPWFRVPSVRAGDLMLSKRTHRDVRLVLNDAGVVTTDTIYRGWSLHPEPAPADVVASFHNSLTLLSCELEGRSFGGGVLELVPSEIARLAVPVVAGAGTRLGVLDARARDDGLDAVVAATDAVVTDGVPDLDHETLGRLRDAHAALRARRLARSRRR
jgi:adenine-specific DNA-methyltransferase